MDFRNESLYSENGSVSVKVDGQWFDATVIGRDYGSTFSYMYLCELYNGKWVTVRSSVNPQRNEITPA